MSDFAESALGQQLYLAVRHCGGFPGVDHPGEMTDMQMAFMYYADVERQSNFLEALGQMFSK